MESSDAAALQAELDELRARVSERREIAARARHDLGNVLSIAESSVEAMLDGVAPVTPARLNRLRELLTSAGEALYRLTAEAD